MMRFIAAVTRCGGISIAAAEEIRQRAGRMGMMRRLYPLSGFPQQRQLWSWISFDVANQSFTLLVNTLLFSIFFSKVVVRDDAIDDRLWALTYGGSMLLTALLSPLLGALADEKAWKKPFLIGSGLMCGVLTCGLAFIQPGQLWLAVLLYVPANLAFAIGENFLASFLPGLARQEQVGRVSGFSWGCAYAAALLLLVLTAAAMMVFDLKETENWRPFFVSAGLWFMVFCIPTALWLREPAAARTVHQGRNPLAAGFVRLGESLANTGRHRDLTLLLVASLFFGTGMGVVVFFASKLAEEFGFSQVALVLFVGVLTVSGIIGTIVPTFFQDRVGHRRSLIALLALWLLTTLGFATYAILHRAHAASGADAAFPVWPLWLIGNLLGFGLGSLGSASRAFVGYLAPPGREAETFGMWGLVWKLSAIMTFPFAWVKDTLGTGEALCVLAGFLAVGLAIVCFIDEKRGAASRG
jgi:MFS transporter, UMF1 family